MQTASGKQTKSALQLKEISIIPITAAVTQPPVEKPTESSQSMADDDSADSLRKKRCTDRCDSSESSDRYVHQLFSPFRIDFTSEKANKKSTSRPTLGRRLSHVGPSRAPKDASTVEAKPNLASKRDRISKLFIIRGCSPRDTKCSSRQPQNEAPRFTL